MEIPFPQDHQKLGYGTMNGISMVATSPGPKWVSHIVSKVSMTIYHIKLWNWVLLCMPPQNQSFTKAELVKFEIFSSPRFSSRGQPCGYNGLPGKQQKLHQVLLFFPFIILILINRHPSSQPPWKSLTEFALRGEPPDHSNPHFQSLVSQVQIFSHRTWWSLIMLDRHVFASNG